MSYVNVLPVHQWRPLSARQASDCECSEKSAL